MKNLQLLEIANKYGSPLYVYDTDKIEEQYNRLTNAFSGVKNLKLNYAVKALSNINILQFFKNIGAGLDTVSIYNIQYTPNPDLQFYYEPKASTSYQITNDIVKIRLRRR